MPSLMYMVLLYKHIFVQFEGKGRGYGHEECLLLIEKLILLRWISININNWHSAMKTRNMKVASMAEECPETKEYSSHEELFREIQKDGGRKLSSSLALRKVYSLVKRQKHRNWIQMQYQMQRILTECKLCRKWDKMDTILTCQRCEDYYHNNCLPSKNDKKPFVCPPCREKPPQAPLCPLCRQELSDQATKCENCLATCHPNCLSKTENICKRCVDFGEKIGKRKPIHKIKKPILGVNMNLREMFERIKDKGLVENSEERLKRKGKAFKALASKKTDNVSKYRSSLLKAIKEKGMQYSEDLKDIEFQLDNMKDSMELGLANMSPEEEKEYVQYKKHPIGPFLVKKQGDMGYGVVADKNIPQYSIICEYVGEVVTLRECETLDRMNGQQNDSKMDLWVGRNSEEKLLIRPEKWTNIGRFLNGVKSSSSSKNVNSLRVCYRGLPVVLLIANRDIKKGQSLVYDYNAGGIQAKYDTSGFIE